MPNYILLLSRKIQLNACYLWNFWHPAPFRIRYIQNLEAYRLKKQILRTFSIIEILLKLFLGKCTANISPKGRNAEYKSPSATLGSRPPKMVRQAKDLWQILLPT